MCVVTVNSRAGVANESHPCFLINPCIRERAVKTMSQAVERQFGEPANPIPANGLRVDPCCYHEPFKLHAQSVLAARWLAGEGRAEESLRLIIRRELLQLDEEVRMNRDDYPFIAPARFFRHVVDNPVDQIDVFPFHSSAVTETGTEVESKQNRRLPVILGRGKQGRNLIRRKTF